MARTIRLGLLGCGTVGSAVMRALTSDPRLTARYEVAGIAVRDLDAQRDRAVDPTLLTTAPLDVATADDVDVVIEVMGGLDPAGKVVEAALSLGKPVVTANKTLLAEHGDRLTRLAAQHGAVLRYEAAVAGAVPAVRTLAQLTRTETVHRLEAVLNGTTTFVLAAMATDDLPLDAAIAQAQAHGYAEADPARDLDGRDAADKLTLLARLLWDVSLHPDDICRVGIDGLGTDDIVSAREQGEAWQVVATASPRCARVELARLRLDDPLARLTGTDNGVRVHTERSGVLTFLGPGAGGDATAASILADLADIAGPATTGFPVDARTFDDGPRRHSSGFGLP
jgi:homoserine dehydrogenase